MSQKKLIVTDDAEVLGKDAWEIEMYKQGSEACRNYSRLTMKTRTLSQQVLIVSVVGLSAVIANKDVPSRHEIVLIGGIALLAFSVSLTFVDWHYQSAFTAIRNALACIEYTIKLPGPWRAHLGERTQFKDHVASYLPFLLLFAIGCLGIGFGIKLSGGSALLVGLVVIPLLFFASFLFGFACLSASKRDAKLNDLINKGLEAQWLSPNRLPRIQVNNTGQ